MNKGLKIFLNVIYYLFTFIMGIMLALYLPYIYIYDVIVDSIDVAIKKADYDSAISYEMGICGGYYNDEYCYKYEFNDKTGLVLYEAACLNDDDEALYKQYVGFLYGLGNSFNTYKAKDNKTNILINGSKKINIIDYDSDNDKDHINDANLTCLDYGFIFVQINGSDSINTIDFINADGETIYNIAGITTLNYDSAFFVDVDSFITEFNIDKNSPSLDSLNKEFLNKSEHYLINPNLSYQQKAANKKAIPIVILYFVFIYLFGDILLGKRFVIKFFRWLLVKVFKVKFKTKTVVKKSGDFVGDYYCKVDITCEFEKNSEFSGPITIKYSNQNNEFETTLTSVSNYTSTTRAKAGIYVNPWLTIDENYTITNMPEQLVVEGYNIKLNLKVKKK